MVISVEINHVAPPEVHHGQMVGRGSLQPDKIVPMLSLRLAAPDDGQPQVDVALLALLSERHVPQVSHGSPTLRVAGSHLGGQLFGIDKGEHPLVVGSF